ncbi:MAG: N-methyl-L-tryptophan oxidase [Rubrivivax sp.]
MSFDGDVLVLGLGAVGAAVLYQLARRGVRAGGIDRFRPPHALGSSHGESRITRLATGEGEAYLPLVRRSHRIWRELEAASGRALYEACGLLVLAPSQAGPGGRADFHRRTLALARAHGIRHERLDAAAVRRRFPALQPPDGDEAYFEPEGGFVRPEAAIEVQLQQARAHGAALYLDETLLDLQPAGSRLRLTTEVNGHRREHRADRVLLALGPWLPAFLAAQLPRPAPLRVYRQVMYWFDLAPDRAAQHRPQALPAFIWIFGDGEADSFYGFPALDPARPRLKLAAAQYRETTTPDAVDRRVGRDELEAFVAGRLRGRIALAADDCSDARACLYTVAPEHRFIVDTLPGLDGATWVSACSGHGFKHSAGLGEALAEQLLGEGGGASDLAAFRWTG